MDAAGALCLPGPRAGSARPDPPHSFSRWAGCDGTTVPLSTVTMDVWPGGRFAGVMVGDADGDRKPFAGVYREVVEPERLVFSWEDPEESVVTITLTDLGDGRTRLHLLQVRWGTQR